MCHVNLKMSLALLDIDHLIIALWKNTTKCSCKIYNRLRLVVVSCCSMYKPTIMFTIIDDMSR